MKSRTQSWNSFTTHTGCCLTTFELWTLGFEDFVGFAYHFQPLQTRRYLPAHLSDRVRTLNLNLPFANTMEQRKKNMNMEYYLLSTICLIQIISQNPVPSLNHTFFSSLYRWVISLHRNYMICLKREPSPCI